MVSIKSETEGSCGSRGPESQKDSVCAYETCTLLDGNPCQPCSRAIAHEALFIRAQNLQEPVDGLLNEKTELLRAINRQHEPFIQHFPLEITAYILKLVLPTNDWYTVRERTRLKNIDIAAPLILGAVCHEWRTIAWSLPLLWAFLPINYRIKPQHPTLVTSCPSIGVAAEWLSRSRNCPLSISILPRTRYVDFEDEVKRKVASELAPLVSLLYEHSHRWKYLDLHIPSSLLRCIEGISLGRPILDRLRLWDVDYGMDQDSRAFQNATDETRPSPTYVAFKNLASVMNIGWENVTEVEATNLAASEFSYLLKHSKQLQHCHVRRSTQDPSTSFFNSWLVQEQPLVVHKTLQSLWLSTCYADMDQLLSKISLPALQSLRYKSEQIPFNNLINLVTNSNACRLTSLSLQGNTAKNGLLSDMLRHTPSLEDMFFDVKNDNSYLDTSNLFQLLGRTSTNSHRSFLPELRILHIQFLFNIHYPWETTLTNFSWGHVADMFGPIEDLKKKEGRRPLSSVILFMQYIRTELPEICPDDRTRFLQIAEAGIDLDVVDNWNKAIKLY